MDGNQTLTKHQTTIKMAHKQNEPPHGETWQGDCWHCQYFSAWQNYCNWYGMELNGHAAEPTCRNPELISTSKTESNDGH